MIVLHMLCSEFRVKYMLTILQKQVLFSSAFKSGFLSQWTVVVDVNKAAKKHKQPYWVEKIMIPSLFHYLRQCFKKMMDENLIISETFFYRKIEYLRFQCKHCIIFLFDSSWRHRLSIYSCTARQHKLRMSPGD